MTEDVVLLKPGDDRAKKIGKALANQTANDILALVKENDLTLTEITQKLGQPMTSTKYHIENLLDAGLVEIKRTKYSEKGREVKVYGASGQIVIVSPGVTDLRQILLKYASIFGMFLFATLVIGVLSTSLFGGMSMPSPNIAQPQSITNDYTTVTGVDMTDKNAAMNDSSEAVMMMPSDKERNVNMTRADERGPTGYMDQNMLLKTTQYGSSYGAQELEQGQGHDLQTSSSIYPMIIGFFLGGCVVILLITIFDIVATRTKKSDKKREI